MYDSLLAAIESVRNDVRELQGRLHSHVTDEGRDLREILREISKLREDHLLNKGIVRTKLALIIAGIATVFSAGVSWLFKQ